MSRSLVQILPQATLLTIDAQEFLVEPLKLRDIAYLEHYLASAFPHPFAARRPEYFAADDPERRRTILRECYLAARDYKQPSLSSTHFDTPKGRIIFLNVLLKDVDAERLFQIVSKTYMDAEVHRQFQEAVRVAYEMDADQEMEYFIESLIPEEADEEPPEEDLWSVRVCDVAEKYGWSLEQVGYLSLRQFLLAYRGGEVVTKSQATGDLKAAAAEAKKRREALFGDHTGNIRDTGEAQG